MSINQEEYQDHRNIREVTDVAPTINVSQMNMHHTAAMPVPQLLTTWLVTVS